MKNLELNDYGVQEMNAVEMQKEEGGSFCRSDSRLLGWNVYSCLD